MQGVHATAFSSILKLIQVPNVTLFNYYDVFFFQRNMLKYEKLLKHARRPEVLVKEIKVCRSHIFTDYCMLCFAFSFKSGNIESFISIVD